MPHRHVQSVSEENFSNLPPPLRARLKKILTDHAEDIVHNRASVVYERRGDGRRYWRLYLESGSGDQLARKRVYVGAQGGKELRRAVRALRRAYCSGFDSPGGLLNALTTLLKEEAREARKTGRSAKDALLAQTYHRSHGRTVLSRRDVPAKQRYRAEYRHLSRRALQRAT